ncbi:DMT family transporter, partial [Escherichia coli]
MKGWLFLVIAIVGEVIATSALKSSEGFTKLAPSAVVIIGYGIAFGTVAKLAMRQPFVLFKGLTFQKLCLPGA